MLPFTLVLYSALFKFVVFPFDPFSASHFSLFFSSAIYLLLTLSYGENVRTNDIYNEKRIGCGEYKDKDLMIIGCI